MVSKFIPGAHSLIPRYLVPKPQDVKAAAGWGVAAGVFAIWLVQPFDWIKSQLSPPAEEK